MQVAVILFPGSNCEHDVVHLYSRVLRQRVRVVWHRETDLGRADLVIVPGGFAYGDYLRTGAMARLSPIMAEVKKFALRGGPVLGICNGFQILCEVGLLPGVLLRNRDLRFLSQFVQLRVEAVTPFTRAIAPGSIITCPIAHGEGNFFADPQTVAELEDEQRVVFRYCDVDGAITAAANPNGSLNSIAGICSRERNVVGLMPHPERASELLVGGCGLDTGRAVFEGMIA